MKPFIPRKLGIFIKLILALITLIPVYLIIIDYENKIIVVLFVFIAINTFIAFQSIDGLTKKKNGETEEEGLLKEEEQFPKKEQ